MKKVMKKLVAVIITSLVAIALIPCTKASAAETFTVYTDVPDAWGQPSIYAWNTSNITEQWPGDLMTDEGNGWFSYVLPVSAGGIVINDSVKQGTTKTDDIMPDGVDMWITVKGAGGNYEISYEAPEGAPGGPTVAAPPDTSGSLEGSGQTTPDGQGEQSTQPQPSVGGNEGDSSEFNPLTIIIPAVCVTAIIIILIVSVCANKKTEDDEE